MTRRFSVAGTVGFVTIFYMKRHWRGPLISTALLGSLLWAEHGVAQFNPRGRSRGAQTTKQTASPKKNSPSSSSDKGKSNTAQKPPPNSRASEAGGSEAPPPSAGKPSTEALIARYTAITLQQPGAPFPLQRLTELYRERDGNLDALVADFQTRLTASPDSLPLLLALASLYEGNGAREKSLELLQRAREAHPKHPAPLQALALAREFEGDKDAATEYLEQAAELQTDALEREQTLRKLRGFALDRNDLAAARKYHERLVREAKGSAFVRAELGKELLDRRLFDDAREAFQEAVESARGDNRALAPALRDLAKAQAAAGHANDAIETLRRALRLTTPDSGTRREILDVLVDTYRVANRIPDLLQLLERESHQDAGQLALLASLYEEAGRLDEALSRYKQALRAAPSNTDVRLRLIRLLELRGDLDAAVSEYRQLIQSDPRNPQYVFQLADLYRKLGRTDAALQELNRLQDRSHDDPEMMAALVDFYERMGEGDKALRMLEKVVALAPRDHQHLVVLGERYFAAGDEKKAELTWRKLLDVVPDRARAQFLLGEVYLEHDMTTEALVALSTACELDPSSVQYKKTLALALERTGAGSGKAARLGNYAEAQALWEKILTTSDSPNAQREARQHITTLWSLQGSLEERVSPLEQAFHQKPPHLPSGRMLAEVQQRLNRLDDAERTLRELVRLTPNDPGSWSALERVLVAERQLSDAMTVAKRLLELEPKRALDHYQRLARYASDLYRDEEALEYAEKAVNLSPDDAEGQKRLGDMYRRRQDIERAILHYRKALAKNDRLFPAYFDLAELLLLQRKTDEADQFLRLVIRTAVEDDVILRASRWSMQLHITDDSLGVLEQELLPLSLSRSNKPVYRNLLLELYSAWMLPLVQKAQSQDEAVASEASQELVTLGQRSVKPLLDALSDPQRDHQRTAIELLSHVRNASANLPLFTYATGSGEPELQARAMLAVGQSGAANVERQLEGLIFDDGRALVDESSPVALAAVWSYCRIPSKSTTSNLMALARSDSPTAQAFALVALALRRETRLLEWLPELLQEASPPLTRAAAAFAAGQLRLGGAAEQRAREWSAIASALRPLTQSADPASSSAALTALARLDDESFPRLAARGLIHEDARHREAALRALGEFYRLRAGKKSWNVPPLPAPSMESGRLEAAGLLERLLPPPPRPADYAPLLPLVESELVREAKAALLQSEQAVLVVAQALTTPPHVGWYPLTAFLDEADAEQSQRARDAAARLVKSLIPAFIVQSTHPNVAVRAAAVRVLTTQTSDEALQAVQSVLERGDEETSRASLATLIEFPNPHLLMPVARLLTSDRPWPLRQLAALTLMQLATSKAASPGADGVKPLLLAAAERDPNAFVREQALLAWAAWADGRQPVATLTRIAKSDPERRVRQTAESLLKSRGR